MKTLIQNLKLIPTIVGFICLQLCIAQGNELPNIASAHQYDEQSMGVTRLALMILPVQGRPDTAKHYNTSRSLPSQMSVAMISPSSRILTYNRP